MRTLLLGLAVAAAAVADSSATQRMFDGKLPAALRANACFEVRGKSDADTIAALSRALDDNDLRSCAADDLRKAGAIDALRQALSSENFQVRAAAARELGSFQRVDLLDVLGHAAEDPNVLVATNALQGLSEYRDAAVQPYLEALAKKGGMIGDMSLERLSQLDPARALTVARRLLSSPQVPDRLYAMRVIGASGDASDVPQLKAIADAHSETLAQRDRGFGFMPAINLSRAAQSAMAAIQARQN